MISGRTVVDGRFELLEPLGSGGMGTVWRAYDVALHREVALKEVKAADPERVSSPGVQRERVLREARALARIGHPNVVAIHHIVDSPGEEHPWIVMELVRGRSLSEQLDMGPMPPERAAQIGRGILAALRAAHAVGVLHRDIKPANVLMREDGSPVLTDFGIAAINGMEGLTSTGSVVGSLDYVAPERLGGQEGHPASDLWSLGLLLYVAVEGYHPLRRDTSVGTLAAVMRGEVPPPRRAGSLTAALQAILVPQPDQRPTAEQVDWLLSQVITTPTPYPAGVPPLHQAPTVTSEPHPSAGTSSEYSLPLLPSGPSHPLSYGGHPAPSGYPATPVYAPPIDNSRGLANDGAPQSNRGLIIAAVIGVVVIAAGVVAAVALRPSSSTDNPNKQAIPSLPVGTNIVQPSFTFPTTQPRTTSAGVDLLTPGGVRQAIAALEKATGGQNFTESTIYPEFITTGAPVKDRPTVYDEYTFRDGAATRTGPGGQISGHPTVALGGIDWDILPALLATAQDKLAVPNPKSHYIIVDPAWTFNDNKPTLLVYYSDEYNGGGYVAADVDGTIVRVYNSK
ncbi:protein kinase [Nocardia sp. NBC_01503]|uniref:serine/threonine-protein kinase n=1 Tax=Nocardia sp. NBC_01503 TaxID=2975997 RepID=UPI002E7BA449|nr:protein kinase [Nocardia sp. NBC_01503]WTL30807.1 protein kinase [Nocardia sp. NBC_01503]